MIAVGLVMALIAPNFIRELDPSHRTRRFRPGNRHAAHQKRGDESCNVPWAGSKTNFLDAREAGSVERTSWSARSCLPVVQRLLSTCHGTKLLGSSGSRVGKEPAPLGHGGPFAVAL